MAITKSARARIFTLVQEIKKLLVIEVASQLEQFYGIRVDGSILMIEQLPATEPEILHTARLLRQRIEYIKSNIPSEKNKEVEAVKQLLNEQAFSILNRFATLRMAEERGIIKETIRKEYNSDGFQIFDSVTGQGKVAEQYIRYKWYLQSIFDELAIDLPSVFDRFSPYALIFPSERALRALLTIINNENVTMHREEGVQPMNLWQEDETIGWIYQYYNSRDEISEMRDASSAPRNSRELAVRNQFFTPRYVVQFLTDNSLGRIWYEMTKGNTILTENCQYLIRRPKELFLEKGNSRPENVDEATDYIEHRAIKDPREILMLDPACGSMHFGLYSFDLFEKIYVEAWDNHPELMLDLRNSITRQQYIKQIPEYIIRYNIHGVDIDPRALQIAALSLWLRAQKSFEKLNLQADERPQITKSNLVLAEAMPGNSELLSELVKPLDTPMRKLVTSIWDLMKMAGETGLLLRIEEEIDKKINEIADDLINEVKGTQLKLGSGDAQLQAAERAAFYSSKKYRDSFLENASTEVFRILKELAETANEGEAYQKLLFADDAARGFSFIELCKKKYDVILMNPPFGAASLDTKNYIDFNYPKGKNDLAAAFVERMHILLIESGFLGTISTRTIFFIVSYLEWRKEYFINNTYLKYFVDLGNGVLDAMVETAAYIIGKKCFKKSIFIRVLKSDQKDFALKDSILFGNNQFIQNTNQFGQIPNQPLCYWLDESTKKIFRDNDSFETEIRTAKQGLATSDNFRFVRNFWEIRTENVLREKCTDWKSLLMSEDNVRFFMDINTCIDWSNNGKNVKSYAEHLYKVSSRTIKSERWYFLSGLSWPRRSYNFISQIVPRGIIFTHGKNSAFLTSENETAVCCSFWNSKLFDYLLKLSLGSDNSPQFEVGLINKSPFTHFPLQLRKTLSEEAIKNYYWFMDIYKISETSLFFNIPPINCNSGINDSIKAYFSLLESNRKNHISSLEHINNEIFKYFNIDEIQVLKIEEIIGNTKYSQEGIAFKLNYKKAIESIFSWLLGIVFGRWDIRFAVKQECIPLKKDVFSALPFLSPGSLTDQFLLPATRNNISSNIFISERKYVENYQNKSIDSVIGESDYPITVIWDGIGVSGSGNRANIIKYIRECLSFVWGKKADKIESELAELLNVRDLLEWLDTPSKFFASHLDEYTQNKRVSPIYWPISTASGSYTIWLFYPKLTDQTLVAVINNYLQPKIDEVVKQKKPLELNTILDNKGLKELKELNDFEHELEDMKKELLRITALPYKPNHDDGVLITAAPLHNLFRHTKWRKVTEDCWKELEKGEYDWAHLAYYIWPDRVTKKCKKDLSMAIAHGLEHICEVKPKEKKEKVVKTTKKTNPINELNFGE